MAPHSSTLAWNIPWMEEPGGLQSMGPQRVGHDLATEQQHAWESASEVWSTGGPALLCETLCNCLLSI